ncbi:MAG: response regulator [Planctomycetes bacterium]|nr:response regulator [Planctomycetota bacterium]
MPNGRILIVEDEGIVAEDLRTILLGSGFEVVGVADSFDAAAQLAANTRPDLALLDIRLKGPRDGIELAAELRRNDIGYVYLTSHADEQTLARAEITEPLGYVLKPFGAREMQPVLQTALYRHAAELRLRNLESWLRTTLASIGDAVVVTDRGARITFLNPCAERLLGATLRQASGQPLHEVMPLLDLRLGERMACVARRAIDDGEIVHFADDVDLVRRDGSRLPVEDSSAPIRDADGGISGAVVVLRDATARRRTEQERLEVERRMRDAERLESVSAVASGLAHDLNNVLTAILGSVQLCRDDGPSEDGAPLTEIESQVRMAAAMCQRLLAGPTTPTPIDPVAVADAVRDSLRIERALATAGIEFSAEFERPDLQVLADGLQFRQVLQNLLRNAAEALAADGGGIAVRAGAIRLPTPLLGERSTARLLRPGAYVWIEVADDGPGIPDDVLPRLFQPFQSTKSSSRGLGLASVSGIVRRHGASIEVESARGVGTVFRLFWPAPDAAGADPERAPVAQRTVLLVDDDDAVRRTTGKLLRSRGWECAEVGTAAEALERLCAEPTVAVVVLDLHLGSDRADELLLALRAERPELPVLLVSGMGHVDPALLFDERIEFLGKPFLVDELSQRLARLLTRPR